MDRRDFLKAIGLGGVALTLPKPLEILAAKATDLVAPPMHVGRAEMTLEKGDYLGFVIYGMALDTPRDLRRDAWEDFMAHWVLRVAYRDLAGNLKDILRTPCRALPMRPGPDPALGWCGNLLSAMAPKRPFYLPSPMILRPGDTFEWWLVPYGAKRPLPRVDLVLTGTIDRPRGFLSPEVSTAYYSLPFDTVRVDRTEAIRMGLVGQEEPEEDFSRPEERREIIRV